MLAGNFAHGLQKSQLKRNRLLADHRRGLHHFLGCLELAFGIDDLGTSLALGLRLLGHCPFHAIGQRDIFDLHSRHFDAPRFGLSVDDFLQLEVDHITLCQQVIQRSLAQHAAQCGLRNKRSRLPKILDFNHRGNRIDNAEINHCIHRGRHIVARHDFLLRYIDRHDAQIHFDHFVHNGPQEDQTWPFGAEQFAQAENDAALVLPKNPDGLRHNN